MLHLNQFCHYYGKGQIDRGQQAMLHAVLIKSVTTDWEKPEREVAQIYINEDRGTVQMLDFRFECNDKWRIFYLTFGLESE